MNPFKSTLATDDMDRTFTRCSVCRAGYADASGRCGQHRGQVSSRLNRMERLYAALGTEVWALPLDRLSAVPLTVYKAQLCPSSSPEGIRDLILALRVVRSIAAADSIFTAREVS